MTFILLSIIVALLLFVLSTSPITRLAFVIKIFLKSGLLFIEKGLPFLGLSYIIVYVGAIAILFLFVIKLVPTSLFYPNQSSPNVFNLLLSLLGLLGIAVAFVAYLEYPDYNLTSKLLYNSWDLSYLEFYDIQKFGYYLFLPYSITVYILSILLWVVLIGVLAISL